MHSCVRMLQHAADTSERRVDRKHAVFHIRLRTNVYAKQIHLDPCTSAHDVSSNFVWLNIANFTSFAENKVFS